MTHTRVILYTISPLLLGGLLLSFGFKVQAAAIPEGCRAATATEAHQLSTAAGTNINIVCGQDATRMNLGEFDQFYARLKQTSPCNKNKCTLACRTRNTGAQVCGSISRKWNSIGCHRVNNTAIFPTVSHGFAAHIDLLRRYCGTYKRCTIGSAIARWAPAGHGGNNPGKYAATVSKWAGFPVNKVYNPNDVDLIGRIALSMSCVENGSVPYNLDELKKGLVMAGGGAKVPVPSNVGQLLAQSNAFTTSGQNQQPGGFLQNSALGKFLGVPQTQSSPSPSSSSSSVSRKPGSSSTQGKNQTPTIRSGDTSKESDDEDLGSSIDNEEGDADNILSRATSTSQVPVTPPKTIKNTPPTLLCLPSPIQSGEEVLLMWACRDGAYKTTGENFDTNEKLIGKALVTPSEDTTYTLNCINDTGKDHTAASCSIDVANPALALIATPSSVARGGSTTLSWKTKDTTRCTITSSTHPTFTRNGTEGDASTPSLTRNTTFTLTCETTTGTVEERELSVGVR